MRLTFSVTIRTVVVVDPHSFGFFLCACTRNRVRMLVHTSYLLAQYVTTIPKPSLHTYALGQDLLIVAVVYHPLFSCTYETISALLNFAFIYLRLVALETSAYKCIHELRLYISSSTTPRSTSLVCTCASSSFTKTRHCWTALDERTEH